MSNEHVIPQKWIAFPVEYGEKMKYFYMSEDYRPEFFKDEAEAQKWAENHCRYDQKAKVVVARVNGLVMAKPVQFETFKTS